MSPSLDCPAIGFAFLFSFFFLRKVQKTSDCPAMGSACLLLFVGFLKVFLVVSGKVQKTSRKPKTCRPYVPKLGLPSHRVCIFVAFCWLSRCFLGFSGKVQKTSRKPKNMQALCPQAWTAQPWGLHFFCVGFLFFFLSAKNLEKTNKNCRPYVPKLGLPSHGVCNVVCCCFLESCLLFYGCAKTQVP